MPKLPAALAVLNSHRLSAQSAPPDAQTWRALCADLEQASAGCVHLDSWADPILYFDAQGRLIGVNHAAAALTGDHFAQVSVTAPGPELTQLLDFTVAELSSPVSAFHRVQALIDDGTTPSDGHAHLKLPNAKPVSVSLVLAAAPDAHPASVLAIVRDAEAWGAHLDSLREQVSDLYSAREKAANANRAKSHFLADMSHELRTPLNAIIGYSELIDEDAASSQNQGLRADIGKVRGAANHLLSILNDVLDLSKIEAGRMELYYETFPVSDLIDDVAATILPLIGRNDNRFEVVCAEDLGYARADKTKLRQVLFNLLSNAARFTANGTITLRASRTNAQGDALDALTHQIAGVSPHFDTIIFDVEDNGAGIAAADVDAIFDVYAQAHASAGPGGSGLGLPISRRFARMMGGDVEVASTPGSGSRFTVTLPTQRVSPQPARPDLDSASRSRIPPDGDTTVLVIDDDPAVHDLMRRFLCSEGYNVVSAFSAEEGLQTARQLRPTVITLDVMMPSTDGWTALSNIKSDPDIKDIPVIMVSMIHEERLGFTLGATDFLPKPIDKTRLRTLLGKFSSARDTRCALVVDDDADARRITTRNIAAYGWVALQAENGRDALDVLASADELPTLIVLDLNMPEMDGFAFLEAIRDHAQWSRIPVVVVTAMDLTPNQVEALRGNVSRILQKNEISADALLAEVRDTINSIGRGPSDSH